MKFTTPLVRMAKGQLRCFECRKTLQSKEGDWHNRGSQQVFLCNHCNKTHDEHQNKQPSNR